MTTGFDEMAEIGTYEWLDRALDGNPVWDLGQLKRTDRAVLDQAVRAGKLCKTRVRWMFISPPKSVWYRADLPPQEVLAQMYERQQEAA